jgi:hypothetical protein
MAMLMYCWHALKLESFHRAVAQPCVDQIRHNKLKLFMCFIKLLDTKTYGGVEVYDHAFLNSAQDGGEWSAACHSRLVPRERAHCTQWGGGWEGPKYDPVKFVKRKSLPRQELNLD